MAIVEGKIETLKKLRESLSRSGVTRFSSVGEIRRFLEDFEGEKRLLPHLVKNDVEAEIQEKQSTLRSYQQGYSESRTRTRNEIELQVRELKADIRSAQEKSARNAFLRVLYYLRISSLTRRASRLEKNLDHLVDRRTNSEARGIAKLENEIEDLLRNKDKIISERRETSLGDLNFTKGVIDRHYSLVAGAIGETAVVNVLRQLPDDYYLINDFSIEFDPPIYNRRENDRIFSVQIDHLLICPSGVFLLETKNWSEASVRNLDLRSPVEQIRRTSFALFVLLNSDSGQNDLWLERHHWGDRRIPIRNIIVMTNKKPRQEFKHAKVLSLPELIGYIQYFEQSLNRQEVRSIFESLKNRM